MIKIYIDGEDAIVGRLGSYAAKELLRGNEVFVFNSEKAIISGNRRDIMDKILKFKKKGGSSQKGPRFTKMPDRMLKRMIRGMLPWDRPKGRDAWRRLKCYIGEGELNTFKLKKEDLKKINSIMPVKYITLKRVSELI